MNREPDPEIADLTLLLLGQLAHYRAAAVDKLHGLSEAQLRASLVPSGWSPIEMLNHLFFMERRWMVWGFAGEQIDRPDADREADERLRVDIEPDRGALTRLAELTGELDALAQRTEAIAAGAQLHTRAQLGGQFSESPPTLGWILLHVLQEYARHVGQLDVVRELVDGSTGE